MINTKTDTRPPDSADATGSALICEECGTSDPGKEVLASGVFFNGGVCPKSKDTWRQAVTICRDCDSYYHNCADCGASMTDYAFAACEKCPECETPNEKALRPADEGGSNGR